MPVREVTTSANAVLTSVAEFTAAAARIQAAIAEIDSHAVAAKADISAKVAQAMATIDAKIASIPGSNEPDSFTEPRRMGGVPEE